LQQQPELKQPEYAKGAFTLPIPSSGGDKLVVLVDAEGVFRGLLVVPPHAAVPVRQAAKCLLDLIEQPAPSSPDLRLI
jgi:hypothetical protein